MNASTNLPYRPGNGVACVTGLSTTSLAIQSGMADGTACPVSHDNLSLASQPIDKHVFMLYDENV